VDISLSGLAVAIEIKPPIGCPVMVGKIRAKVVRHFEEGIAVEFATQQTAVSLEQNL
jgi:hypothetical protein